MTQKELIEKIKGRLAANTATKHIHEKTVIGHVLDALGDVAADAFGVGDEVPLPGLGKLVVRDRAARRGRNPKTGAVIDIPAGSTVFFRPGKALKGAMNE